jgi:hypothetical protein
MTCEADAEPSGLLTFAGSTLEAISATIPDKLPLNAFPRCSARAGHLLMLYIELKSRLRRCAAVATAGVGRSRMGTGDL